MCFFEVFSNNFDKIWRLDGRLENFWIELLVKLKLELHTFTLSTIYCWKKTISWFIEERKILRSYIK